MSHTQSFMLCHIDVCFLCNLSGRLIIDSFVLQRMCGTSSARPQCTTTFPSTGTASSSVCTSGTTARKTSATSSSPSSCRCALWTQFRVLSLKFYCKLYLHSTCGVVFLGAAVGACTPGIRPEGQREEWRHHCHGLQRHYGHHQTPHAHTFCGGEPCVCECLCVCDELTDRLIFHCGHREYSDWRDDECYFQHSLF